MSSENSTTGSGENIYSCNCETGDTVDTDKLDAEAGILGGTKMRSPCRQFLHYAVGAAAFAALSCSLLAATGPGAWSQVARTIKFVVAISPGGAGDILAR